MIDNYNESAKFINVQDLSPDELFGAYAQILPPLRELENACKRQVALNEQLSSARNQAEMPALTAIATAISMTFLLAIPFSIIFDVVTWLIHSTDGRALFYAYDEWVSTLPIISNISNGIGNLGEGKGVLISLLILILFFIWGFVITPTIVILFPSMVVSGIITTIVTVKKAKATIVETEKMLPEVAKEIDDSYNQIKVPLTLLVPPDYRYSAAIEFFCSSYRNGKVSSQKEAVTLYDEYVHNKIMEQGQQEALKMQREIFQKLQEQDVKMNDLQRKVDHVNSKVGWF